MKPIDKLRAQIAADPEAVAFWKKQDRKFRPLELKAMAWIEAIFPPESPTSKSRGGRSQAPSLQFKVAVCWMLDARMGVESDGAEDGFAEAMATGDPDFFRMMADAAEYVRNLPRDVSTFADCVITARRIAAEMMGADEPLPSRGTVIDGVIKYLGPAAFPKEEKSRWSEVMKAARLSDLKRDGSARKSLPMTSGFRSRMQ